MNSKEYAALVGHSYDTPDAYGVGNESVKIGDVQYRVVEHIGRPSGYQGVIYQRVDTGEVIVAHRGTEFDRQFIKDGALADGGMVVTRVNSQIGDASELTQRAIEYAKQNSSGYEPAPQVTVVGHSLGGCLAQVTAARFNLNGETFNPYGAPSLGLRIPEGGNQVINHVMAGDLVSAGSKHFGEVRMYAVSREIDTIRSVGRYEDNGSSLDIRFAIPAAIAGADSHKMHNFLDIDAKGQGDQSVLDGRQARQLAEQHRPMFDKYRNDVYLSREGLSIGSAILRGTQGVANEVWRHLPDDKPESPFKEAHGGLDGKTQLHDPRHTSHPAHEMHETIKHGVEQVYSQQGLPLGEGVERTTAALLVSSRQAGLEQINHVVPGRNTNAGTDVFAVQGELHDPAHKRAQVNTEVAAQIPVEASFRKLAEADQQQAVAQSQQSQEQTRTQAARTA
ncbi:XVIPCD domain-containing protein [Lysobacter sp. CA196]|uniref:XVIPCD domain-containing protein n=1 Tax=Lysobacter sp. CA196 TaxID=3455606 RepID=UPI003F8D4BC6